MSKYGNRMTCADGIKFDSKKESLRYLELKMLERAGIISNLRLQVPYVICPSVILNGRKQRPVIYKADFVYVGENGQEIVEDAKGCRLPMYVLKRKLMKHVYGIEVVES